jgi:hypothetical protein
MGIKLANIFSSEFRLRVVNPSAKKSFRQKWTGGMEIAEQPKIKDCDDEGSVEIGCSRMNSCKCTLSSSKKSKRAGWGPANLRACLTT